MYIEGFKKEKKKNEEEGKGKAVVFWEIPTFTLRESAKYLDK